MLSVYRISLHCFCVDELFQRKYRYLIEDNIGESSFIRFVTFINLSFILGCMVEGNGAYDNDNVTLDPESYRIREVYAYFGLTMYHIQCLERTLSMLGATVYNSNADHITRSQFDSILEVNFKKTLGQLIAQIKKSVDLSDSFENKLADALKKRNFLAHHYFWKRAMKFSHTRGQEEMLAELIQLSGYFKDVDRELE